MSTNLNYNKLRGGYYTPKAIADFLTQWAIKSKTTSVLEPSSGDGVFVESSLDRLINLGLNDNDVNDMILSIELDPNEANKIVSRIRGRKINNASSIVKADDFFNIAKTELIGNRLFDAVVGNPPFIGYQNFVKEYRDIAFQIMRDVGLNPTKLTNIWVPFLVVSASLLNQGGRLGMVIPAELFQVNYTGETRKFLADCFSEIIIITFRKLLFPKIQQEVILLLGEKNGGSATTIRTIELEDVKDIVSLNLNGDPNIESKTMIHSKDKWTYYFLSMKEISFLQCVKRELDLSLTGEYLDVDVGVVTGQNKFFVLPHSKVLENNLQGNVHRIVTRSAHLKGVTFGESDWEENQRSDYPMYLFMPPDKEFDQLPKAIRNYIRVGEKEKYHKGYKCSIRKTWHMVPSIWIPDVFMLRQIHSHPKLILNDVKATCTDTIHRVKVSEGVDRRNLAAGFLNSLTFAFSELIGRSYGGGVLTFEPSECEKLPIPIKGLEKLAFDETDRLVRKNRIDEVLDMTDKTVLIDALGLSLADVKLLRNIWQKLRDRRVNRNHNSGKKASQRRARTMPKPQRKVYHVTPNPGGGWDIQKQGGKRASGHFDKKAEAVDRGKELAKSGPVGQIKIHKQDGTIQTEHTYGEDQYPPEG